MFQQLLIGLCLVIIFEGLLLFAAPRAWQRLALDLAQTDPNRLRAGGGIAIIIGMLLLQAAV